MNIYISTKTFSVIFKQIPENIAYDQNIKVIKREREVFNFAKHI